MITPTLSPTCGSDPEFFLNRAGQVVGSEKLIPEEGLTFAGGGKVVRDGVQVEFNPLPGTINVLGRSLTLCFTGLMAHLKGKDAILDWRGLVEIAPEEIASLSPENRELGCQPSENVYGLRPIDVDGVNYRKRSAGGHLHFGGLPYTLYSQYNGVDYRPKLIPLFDIFVGNSCVLLDRDPGQQERRLNYGRAGEYRLQPHGVEYRTPSNFWLRGYPLMDFVFGMGRFCVELANLTAKGDKTELELVELVDIDNFIRAIDTNDAELAERNYRSIVPFMRNHLPAMGFPLNPKNLDNFLKFGDAVRKDGLTKWFSDPPEVHWVRGEQVVFDRFLGTLFPTS